MKQLTLTLTLLVHLFISPSKAQWTSNPLENNSIASKTGEQALPKIVTHTDGSVYICWFTTETGSYNVRLQCLDDTGNALWGDNGILVSSEPQETWITDYDMAIDPTGHAIITFMDIRTGNPNPVAYRISPEGEHMWGASGILLANNSNFDPSPKVCVTEEGNAVFAWQSAPSGPSEVRLQKISPDGQKLWGDEGIILLQSGVSYTSPNVFPADGDHVFFTWYRETGPFYAPNRGLYAQKLDVDGSFMWASETVIYAPVASGPVYYLETCRDDEGGIIFTWYRNHSGTHFHCYIQRMTFDGQITMPPAGALMSVSTNRNHFYPVPAFLNQTQEIICFFSEQDLNQNDRGFYAQKFDLAGNRLWTDEGKQLIPLGNNDYGLFMADGHNDKAICIYQAADFGNSVDSKMQAVMLDAAGDYVWPAQFINLSTYQSEKLHNVMTGYFWGQWVTVWEDRRNDSGDIFAQNIQPDGTLGAVTTAIHSGNPNHAGPVEVYPNPFNDYVNFSAEIEIATISIYDSKGNLVLSSGFHNSAINIETSFLSSGLYFYQIVADSGQTVHGKIVKQ
ncbi:MAG: T9SS type A sorting domain-containing protein [Bacteroidales bacterium]|nr:T9SS type A sorting domain-containing protein [Bacteroidales bacterium]